MDITDLNRFWSRVNKHTQFGCWEWTGSTHPFGYGRITVNKKQYLAHRLSYELVHGVINQSNLCVCHHCDNPRCVNPDHLFLGDRNDNALDRTSKGRTYKGSQVTISKFTEQQVLDIRSSKLKTSQLAKLYNTGYAHIWAIQQRKIWKHI